MAAISGKSGTAKIGASNTILYISKWTLNREVTTTRWADSSAAGYKQTLPGVKSCTMTIEYKHDDAGGSYAGHVILEEGDILSDLRLYPDSTATKYWKFPVAVVKANTATVDIDNGETVSGTATIESSGTYSYETT